MGFARIAHVRLPAGGIHWHIDQLAENDQPGIAGAAAGMHGLWYSCCPQGAAPVNMPPEAVMRTGSALLLVWLIIGAIAGGQAGLTEQPVLVFPGHGQGHHRAHGAGPAGPRQLLSRTRCAL
jgi:hypothetical protein